MVERTAAARRMIRIRGLRIHSMMKNCALLTVCSRCSHFALLAVLRSGPTIDTIAVVRANMQADRTTLITTGMNFNDKDGEAFWPIYKQYQYERSLLDDRRVAVIKEYNPEVPDADRCRG